MYLSQIAKADTAERQTRRSQDNKGEGGTTGLGVSPLSALQRLADGSSQVRQLQNVQALANGGQVAQPYPDVIQRNAFLTGLANANSQIDYGVISNVGATQGQQDLCSAISAPINKHRRKQAILNALEAENLGAEFEVYLGQSGWTLAGFLAAGQDIRSSHSGGAIDPELPQAAYEAAPVAGGGLVVSVAPPALNTLAERANYDWLEQSTTMHTTDPDHPSLRGPSATGGAKPTLGSVINAGAGGGRLAASANRVASYFELGASKVRDSVSGIVHVDGTRVVVDPFNNRYFVSEHYAKQYELLNVPAANTLAIYQGLRNLIQQKTSTPAYLAANPAGKLTVREAIYAKLLK